MLNENFNKIIEDFDYIDEWEDKYRYIIDLGKKLDDMKEELKTDANKVDGCASQVWISYEKKEEHGEENIFFSGDSDAIIVKGLIAIVFSLYQGLSIKDAKKIKPKEELKKLGLNNYLSSQRSNGLFSMLKQIEIILSK